MAWLQNLAGKAEDLLVRIDKNAATVLSDTGTKLPETSESRNSSYTIIEPFRDDVSSIADVSILFETKENANKDLTISSEPSGFSDNISIISEKSGLSDIEDGGLSFPSKQDSPTLSHNGKHESKPETGGFHSKSSSLQNSFISLDDFSYKMEEKITKLEQENESLNQQLINMRHMVAEIQNYNTNLQSELDRVRETLLVTETEMEQYRARAQRVLQEKEKLIALRDIGNNAEASSNEQIMITYTDELKKELKFQEAKSNELSEKLAKANNDLTHLQRNFISIQKDEQEAKQKLREFYSNEMNLRSAVEAECIFKSKELQLALEELTQRKKECASKSNEIAYLKEQFKKRQTHVVNEDLESRLHSLTQTLMYKQDTLETLTTERNALLLQLEKYEKQHYNLLTQLEKNSVGTLRVKGSDESKMYVPQFLKISPFDARVTRNVKRAYSSLDALSVRTGVFLRRYPVARVFVFCYMVLLHLWVLFILWTYVPLSNH